MDTYTTKNMHVTKNYILYNHHKRELVDETQHFGKINIGSSDETQ